MENNNQDKEINSIHNNKIVIVIIIISILLMAIAGYKLFIEKPGDDNLKEVKSAEKRKEESIEILKKEGIGYNEYLHLIPDSTEISMRSKKEILSRAIASYAAANVAIDYNWHKDNLERSKEIFKELITKFNVEDSLINEEKIMFYGEPTDEMARNIEWTLEASKVLFWMLGFIDDLNYPSENNITSALEIDGFLSKYNSFDEILNDVKLIDVEKILDYADLYFRYHWACVDKRVNGTTSTANLSSDIVYERRRAFEWTINSKEDWYNFNSST